MGSSVSMPIFIITSAQIPLSACSQYTHARIRSIIRSSREIMRNCRFSPRRIASTLPVASGSSLRFPENSIFHSMVLCGFHSIIQTTTAASSPERCSLHFVPCAAQSHPLRRDGTTGFPASSGTGRPPLIHTTRWGPNPGACPGTTSGISTASS